MSKKKAPATSDMAYMNHVRLVSEMREGRVQRAATFVNRKKEASRKACRGRGDW